MVLEWTLAQSPINKYRLPAILVQVSRGISLERAWGGREFTVHETFFFTQKGGRQSSLTAELLSGLLLNLL